MRTAAATDTALGRRPAGLAAPLDDILGHGGGCDLSSLAGLLAINGEANFQIMTLLAVACRHA